MRDGRGAGHKKKMKYNCLIKGIKALWFASFPK